MKTMKQICAVSLTLALAVVASGCNTDDLSDAGHTFPDKPAEKMTIHATTGQQSGTRVAYEDGAAGMNGKLTWQKGDRLTVMRMNGSDYVAHADDYEYGGTDGATSGPFTGTAITGAGNSWTIYYPHTVAVNTYYATVTLPMTGQTQTADGNTDHLRNYLLLSSTGIKDLDAGFDLEMQNSIMKFEFSNVPAEVGELTRLVWAAETETDSRIPCTHYLMLNFAPGAVTFDADKHTLTAYLAFMPEEMKVKIGGKFTVMLMGDKTYLAETTIDGGKTYAAGMRYTAVVDGTSMKWEEKKAVMIFTVRPEDYQFNIPFPESGTTPAELTVDWGDGTTPTTVASGTALSSKDAFCHSYLTSTYVNYTIIITSGQTDKTLQQIPPFGYDRRGSRGKLISIDTPLLNTAETDFGSCFNGYGLRSIPEDLFANNPQATDFSYCFYETRLQSIPEGLFAHNPQATDFRDCFNKTLLQSVPEGLFANNPQATNFRDCFSGTSLQSVPEGLFANNLQATDFWGCFSGTLLQSVPEDLFAHNPQATNFYHCCSLCTSLQSVPEGLFAHNPQVTDFSYCFYKTPLQSVPEGLFAHNPQATNFSYCLYKTSLQSVPEGLFANNTQAMNFSYCFSGTPLQSVPESLFANNTQVTNFKECFKDCTSLESVPTGLFANSPQVKDFTYCFEGCTALQSVPEGLFTNNTQVTNFKECFKDCTSLESVPTGLFANSPQVTDFSGCFEGCTALQSLPSGLFASTVATDFNCFYRCTSLRSIPADLLAKLPAVTNLSGCFSGCTALRSIPAGLFDKNTRITSFRRCFADCTALNSIPNKLFDNNTSVTDFTGCFEGSSMAVIPKGVFDNNKWVESFENCFKDCLPLRAVPTGLFDKNTRATNFRRCFSGCLNLGMNEAIFSATKDYKQRFPNTYKKMDFRECFKGAGSATAALAGSAPELWNYDFGRAGYSSTDCFANVSSYLNNYSIIPSAWGGVKE